MNTSGKAFKFALRETVQFAERIEFKLPNNLYCGIPYLEIKLRDKLKTLTASEIKKIEDDIAKQLNDPTIPVDENGNKLLELDIDGEKVPAVIGTIEVVEDSGKVGLRVKGAGKVAKYPINNFLDFVNSTFTTAQKQLFTKADNFYKSFNPSFNVNELRGIDFDFPVTNVIKQENDIMYQMCKLDANGEPYFGQYFFDNVNEDLSKLGIGDLNQIALDGRVKVKITLDDNVDFLNSKTANIEDWNGSGKIFDGGGNQFYNPTVKTKIKLYEILP